MTIIDNGIIFFTQFLLCPLFSIQVRSEAASDVLRAVRPHHERVILPVAGDRG